MTLSERAAAARAKAERETYDRLALLLTDARCSRLDGPLVTDAEIGMAQLRWLNTRPVEASAAAVKTEVAKLLFLRGLDAHTLDLSVLPAERCRFLAAVGRRSSMAKLARREPHRGYPIVLTVLAQSAVDVPGRRDTPRYDAIGQDALRRQGLHAIVMRPAGVPCRLSLGRAARRGRAEGSHRRARSTRPGGY